MGKCNHISVAGKASRSRLEVFKTMITIMSSFMCCFSTVEHAAHDKAKNQDLVKTNSFECACICRHTHILTHTHVCTYARAHTHTVNRVAWRGQISEMI